MAANTSNTAIHHRSATEQAAAIAAREISSRELLDLYVERIEALDDAVNAVVTLDVDRARAAADAADAATVAGRADGLLHGIPITVKDALAVDGVRSTGGATELTDHVATADADVVALVRRAGAIPFAKTNVPRWSGDIQTFNDMFGTTNNPWDTTRTPGGSSGGPAAAVALGFTGFELGTDIGGSIRIPAAFNGICGHKPSFGLVPCGGYIDRVDYGRTEPDINVHGPLARSVDDLEVLMDLLAAPRPERTAAVTHRIPPVRHERIADHRIAVWADEAGCPSSADTRAAVEFSGDVLATLGAQVDREARPDLDATTAAALGLWLIAAATSPSLTDDEFGFYAMLANSPDTPDEVRRAVSSFTATPREWFAADDQRSRIRNAWREFFGDIDALVCPVIITPAFAHLQEGNLTTRTLPVDGTDRPYVDLLHWTALIGMAYLPATVVPVGTTSDGLPVGVQIVGPYMEDRTPIAIARALRDELGPIRFPEAPVTIG
jgi:amidase